MNYFKKILGINDLIGLFSYNGCYTNAIKSLREEQAKQFERHFHLLCKAVSQIAVMRQEIEGLKNQLTEKEQTSDPVAPLPQKTGHAVPKNYTLEKDNTHMKIVMNFLKVKRKATIDEIYRATSQDIVTFNQKGKRTAVKAALGNLNRFGFVRRISYGVYQYTGDHTWIKNI